MYTVQSLTTDFITQLHLTYKARRTGLVQDVRDPIIQYWLFITSCSDISYTMLGVKSDCLGMSPMH